MRNPFYKIGSFLLLLSFFAVSCTSDDRETPKEETPPSGDYAQGIFILNEGGFGYSNASVSFLDAAGQIYNSIYSNVNSTNLGDTAQSMGFEGDNAYIVVNNSSTIEVVNRNSFQHIATVSNMIVNPRYIVFKGNKGYISNWGDPNNVNDDYLAVLNLETNLVEAKISVVEGPEKLLVYNGKIYVAHKGGYGYGNTISVIDMASQSLLASIPVADVPNGMVIKNGFLYVICSGKQSYTQDETLAKLFRINLENNNIENVLTFPQGKHPGHLELDNETLFYVMDNNVYTISLSDFQLSQNPLFEPTSDGVELLYGFKVNQGNIYIADAKDYVSNGEVFIYNLTGDLQQKHTVQIIPNSFYFNN